MDDNLTNKEKKRLSNLLSKVGNKDNDYNTQINVSLISIYSFNIRIKSMRRDLLL